MPERVNLEALYPILPPEPRSSEGLGWLRLVLVLAAFWPLFILWAVRGSRFVDGRLLAIGCLVAIALPHLALAGRIWLVQHRRRQSILFVDSSQNSRDHVLVYLFAVLLPLYSLDSSDWRGFATILVAFTFIAVVFWVLRLHYVNLLFEIAGYHAFTVQSPNDGNPLSGHLHTIVLTHRSRLPRGRIEAYPIGHGVLLEVDDGS